MTSLSAVWALVREHVVYPIVLHAGRPGVRLLWRTSAEGLEHIPRRGGVIVAFNHPSFLDGPVLLAHTPRPIYFIGKRHMLGPRPLVSFLEHVGGQIPIDTGVTNEHAITRAIDVLESGRALGVAPEGTRPPDGRLRRGFSGVAAIAYATGAPIVPVALVGTYEAWPRSKTLPRFRAETRVVAAPPITVPRDREAMDDPRRCRELTDRVMSTLAGLLGQPFDFPGVPDAWRRPDVSEGGAG